MSAQAVVQLCMERVPTAVAAGVVDLRLGTLLAIHKARRQPEEVLDFLAPATKQLFEGPMVLDIEREFRKARGIETTEHYFQEFVIVSEHHLHYVARMACDATIAIAVVACDSVTMGLFLARAREVRDTVSVWP